MTVLPFDLPQQPEPTLPPPSAPAGRLAPERLYDSPLATVWHGDARDVLRILPTESVGLVVTDPPYGQEWQSNRRTEKFERLAGDGKGAEDRAMVHEVLRESVRIVGQHRHLYVFGPTDVLEGLKVAEAVSLIWDKGTMGSGDVTAAWGPSHEPITFTVSKHRHAGKTGASTVPARLRKGTVLAYNRPTGRNVRHPSEKPVPLMRELIESSSRQGETILDPFAGSGSTGVAAILTGRKVILIEKTREYAEMSAARCEAAEAMVAKLDRI